MESAELNLQEIMRRFPDEKSALDYFETIRWPSGMACPHCDSKRKFYIISGARSGLKQCADCKKQFRATVGTIFEGSHIPLHKWLVAWFLLCGAKKGMSALQLKRRLWGDKKGSYKTAWFMAHRIRHAMQEISNQKLAGTVEVDETYVGGKNIGKGWKRKMENKTPVVSIVERGGKKRSVVIKGHVTGKNLKQAIRDNVLICSDVITDDYMGYRGIEPKYTHRQVKHMAKEFARKEKDLTVHTNTVESSFGLLKRGIIGSFHHISRKHLPLYLNEFDYRWNTRKQTDGERTLGALGRTHGKRLTMRQLVQNED